MRLTHWNYAHVCLALAALPAMSWAGAGLTGSGVSTSTPPAAATPHTILPLSTRAALSIPAGSVMCGVDSIFFDGLETPAFLLLTQIPGAAASPGLVADITGTGSLSVAITSPASGTTVAGNTVDVSGTFVGPVNTGIAIDGVAGSVANGSFLVPNVPIGSGSNTLTATATLLTGASATNAVTVTQSGTNAVGISVNRPIDYLPTTLTFTYSIGALPSGFPAQTITINFRGSGANDFSGSSLTGAPSSYRYTAAGLYKATLSVTDTHGNTYTAIRGVLVQDLAVQRGMMCDVYGYLQSQLTAGSAMNASKAFQPVVQSQYQALFSDFGATNMATMAQQLGVVVSGMLGQGFVDLLLDRDDTTGQTRAGFPMRLTQSADGVWRISEM